MIIHDIKLSYLKISDILKLISTCISNNEKKVITYFNVNTFNILSTNKSSINDFKEFDLVHPDGLGILLASKILFGKDGFSTKITGSDLYVELITYSINNNYSFFFFGDSEETLEQISSTNPSLNVKGYHNGFNYENTNLIGKINEAAPDILLVGLGSPKQEEWIVQNRFMINPKVIIAVGDGIKVFAGTKKRGPKIFQKLGLEWIVRIFFEPKRLWKRYIIGIPLFTFRIIKFKFSLKNP